MLFRFKKVDSSLCSYCNKEQETLLHLFHSCLKTKQLWSKSRQYFSKIINIPHSTPQSSIPGIFDDNQHWELINHLSLIFKFYIYSARNPKQLNCDNLMITIWKSSALLELGKMNYSQSLFTRLIIHKFSSKRPNSK